MATTRRRGPSKAKVVVIAALAGAVLFGVYLGYLAWVNGSFPVQQRPFGDYASVVSESFNGTEVAFNVKWLSSEYQPYLAQVTSSSDVANTPPCGVSPVNQGDTVFMPFSIAQPSAAIGDIQLSIAVRSVSNGTEFTLIYNAGTLTAPKLAFDIMPSNLTCKEPAGIE
jgi:hypothetical protein